MLVAGVFAVFTVHNASLRKRELRFLKQENTALHQQAEYLAKERDSISKDLAAAERSRNEIDRLNALTDPNAEATLQSWLSRVHLLKERLEKTPEKKIPELKFLTEEDWLDITRTIKLESEFDFAEAMAKLRMRSKSTAPVAGNIQVALAVYMDANSGHTPASISQLKPYLRTPVDDDVLNRYEIVFAGSTQDLPRNKVLLQEKQLVDDDYDYRLVIFKDGMTFREESKNGDAVKLAITAFAKANNEQKPSSAEQLIPYLQTPLDSARLQHHWTAITTGNKR
jgi:hypothetical protein